MNPTETLKTLIEAIDNHRLTTAEKAAAVLKQCLAAGEAPDYSRLTPSEGWLLADIVADFVEYWA